MKIVPIVPTKLLFNLDETGLSEWENRKGKSILVPAQEQESTLHYPADRSVRHHTLLCCVTAFGDSYCPILIAPTAPGRNSFDTGVRDHIDLIIEVRQRSFFTVILRSSYFQLWRPTDNLLAVRISSVFSFVISREDT
jgi:hypothetical protein